MKNSNVKLVAVALACASFTFSSCIGSFALHNRLNSWNQSIGDR